MSRDFRHLMGELAQAHAAFKEALRQLRAPDAPGSKKHGHARVRHEQQRWQVTVARHERDKRAVALWSALGWDEFEQGERGGIERAILFLEADVPGHLLGSGWGYARQKIWRKLKQMPLSPTQSHRLQQLALKMCLGQSYRHEIRQAARLMIRLADEDFAARLAQVLADPAACGQGAYQAALLMAHRVAHHRPELKPILFP